MDLRQNCGDSRRNLGKYNKNNILLKMEKNCSLLMLPQFLHDKIALFLPFNDLLKFLSISRSCSELLHHRNIWEFLLLRDFPYFLTTSPLSIDRPFTVNELEIKTLPLDSAMNYPPDYKPVQTQSERQEALKAVSDKSIEFLKAKYREIFVLTKRSPPFSGNWIGDYSAHGLESLKLFQNGFTLFAIKVTGDINVPATKMTWKVNLNSTLTHGRGVIHIADTGFMNPRWAPVEIQVLDNNKIIVAGCFPNLGRWIRVSLGCTRKRTGEETTFMSIKIQEML